MNYTERTNKIIDLLVTKNDEQETLLKGNVIQIANLELAVKYLVRTSTRARVVVDPLLIEILPEYGDAIKQWMRHADSC